MAKGRKKLPGLKAKEEKCSKPLLKKSVIASVRLSGYKDYAKHFQAIE